jgi:hypothetical protein
MKTASFRNFTFDAIVFFMLSQPSLSEAQLEAPRDMVVGKQLEP